MFQEPKMNNTSVDSSKTSRPLPKWLLEQKERNTDKDVTVTGQTSTMVIEEDNSVLYALGTTGVGVLLIVIIISVLIVRKNRKSR